MIQTAGQRAHLVANSKSGKGLGLTLADEALKVCQELGWELVTYPTRNFNEFNESIKHAVTAAENDGGVVIVAGGDGTIRSGAQEAHGKNVRFAAVPIGTFNFFARTHGIPENHIEAFRVALTGTARAVRLGEVNGLVFLINASLGLYVQSIRDRESRTGQFGRNRLIVIISTIMSLFSKHFLLTVGLIRSGVSQTARTPMIFIGNNALQLRSLALNVANCMKDDLLAVVLMRPISKFETLRIIVRGIFKTIENEDRIESFCVDELTIKTRKPLYTIALDGELFQVPTPLKIKALPGALNLILPLRKAT